MSSCCSECDPYLCANDCLHYFCEDECLVDLVNEISSWGKSDETR